VNLKPWKAPEHPTLRPDSTQGHLYKSSVQSQNIVIAVITPWRNAWGALTTRWTVPVTSQACATVANTHSFCTSTDSKMPASFGLLTVQLTCKTCHARQDKWLSHLRWPRWISYHTQCSRLSLQNWNRPRPRTSRTSPLKLYSFVSLRGWTG
jgi:hypothetical protein